MSLLFSSHRRVNQWLNQLLNHWFAKTEINANVDYCSLTLISSSHWCCVLFNSLPHLPLSSLPSFFSRPFLTLLLPSFPVSSSHDLLPVFSDTNSWIFSQWTYLLGGVIAIGGFLCLFFGRASDSFFSKYGIYLVSAAMGVSGSTMLITSLGITNDLIGHNTVSSSPSSSHSWV